MTELRGKGMAAFTGISMTERRGHGGIYGHIND